jgi:pterin-4a-carbinolamine dehydratase
MALSRATLGGEAPLSAEDIATALRDMVPQWRIVERPLPEDASQTCVEFQRVLQFRSFLDALKFMTEVGQFCDDANHHPRWENVYRTVWISLSTWDIGQRVSHLDLILAAHIDRAYERYVARSMSA